MKLIIKYNTNVEFGIKEQRYRKDIETSELEVLISRQIDNSGKWSFNIEPDNLRMIPIFSNLSFYHYISIAHEILDLINHLKSEIEDSFVLYLYEINTEIYFTVNEKNVLINIKRNNQLLLEEIKLIEDVIIDFENLNNSFELILKDFFPKAYKIFKSHNMFF